MRTRTRIVTGSMSAALIVAGSTLWATQSTDSQDARSITRMHAQMDQMQDQIDDLDTRVFMLETLVHDDMSSAGSAELPADRDRDLKRVMKLEVIDQAPVDSGKLSRAQDMLEEAEEWEQKAERLERRIAQQRATRDIGHGAHDNDSTRELGRVLGRYRREARNARGEGLRLKREAEEPKQIIKGWDGERKVVLHATRNLASMLDDISAGEFLTWDGRRTYLSEAVARYKVTSVQAAPQPEDFTTRDEAGATTDFDS